MIQNMSEKVHCLLYIKTPFEIQLEDGFIKKPKHVANMIF